jgi:molecular chaperone GrpE
MTNADIKKDENNLSKDPDEKQSNEVEQDVNIKPDKESAEDQLKIIQEKLLRTLAEMENQRRRFEKEKKEAFEYGGFNFAAESISLLDNIERAVVSFKNDESLKNSKDLHKVVDGIDIIKNDLVSIFKKNGVTQIDCINKKFDPNYHQAMLELEDNSKESGTVVQEIQKGYMMKDRLLRPSFVGVTKKRKENENNSKNEEKK